MTETIRIRLGMYSLRIRDRDYPHSYSYPALSVSDSESEKKYGKGYGMSDIRPYPLRLHPYGQVSDEMGMGWWRHERAVGCEMSFQESAHQGVL